MNPITTLQAALDARAKIVAEIQSLHVLETDTAARCRNLETDCAIDDSKALSEIGRLQVVLNFLPRRVAARKEVLGQADVELTKRCNEFIQQALGPRVRGLVERAHTKVRGELQALFVTEADLEAAVAKTALVVEASMLDCPSLLIQQIDRPVSFAERLLRAWSAAEAFESKLA